MLTPPNAQTTRKITLNTNKNGHVAEICQHVRNWNNFFEKVESDVENIS